MTHKKTAIPAILGAVLCLTMELSFTYSSGLNLYVCLCVVSYLVFTRRFALIGLLLLFPFVPALTTGWSVLMRGSGSTDAWILVTRTYAFAALGVGLLAAVDFEECFLVLEYYRLSPTFVYGILVVVHAAPAIRREVKQMWEASLLRGKRLYPWSAYYYVKTIFLALNWRDRYTEAMYSRGFTEEGTRSHFQQWSLSKRAVLIMLSLLIVGNLFVGWEG